MTDKHRGFWISGGREPVMKVLIGPPSGWFPSGTIGYTRRNRSSVELTRFQLRGLEFDDENVARIFGLEIARLLVDGCIREFAIERYETEKQQIQQRRLQRR